MSLADRFWPNVDVRGPAECWPWTGRSRLPDGRGVFWLRDRTVAAPRVAFELAHGREPSGQVLHRCSFPPCCNPACLYEGDYILNAQDAVVAGTAKEGARKRYVALPHGPAAKLTEQQVAEIRWLYASGQHTQAALAGRFGIHQTNVSLIVRRRTW